ncbi:cationic amino acid transporter 7, chloroplastic-like isoform X2 [Salvia splendens]|uniref:cationic amino acid transporter 7, chloroplastic-like isoform X2 n=1 Tax=Salvia splendens TaxID=180675 RepID=UPI001C263704|nr:cationic amino acid transporter 7, chloroplastic-like isoform X2 [Salvia splendens]
MENPSSFSSFKSYLHALSDTPHRLSRRACSASASSEETARARARSGSDLRRSLRWHDLIGFGLGGMVGAGVFVTSGRAARLCAGPAVVLSYALAGLCALLSAFCYTEFAVEMPVAGGAFSYIRATFGEFLAFVTGANLVIDYVLSNAAVARGFTAYLATALGHPTLRLTLHSLPEGYNEMDPIAVAIVLLLTFIICYSTRESSWLNMVLTVLHILFIVFVIVVGFWRGDMRNFTEPGNPENAGGFFPFGASGVFNGAAMVYLSYIGYDAVSTMAEEVKNPAKNIPVGVSGSVILVTVLYCLMAASMSALLPYDKIDPEAPFSGAFEVGAAGWRWAGNMIGAGASMGIVTSLLVAMLGQARYMCVIGRSCVVPTWFAQVHPATSTPVNASAFLGQIYREEVHFNNPYYHQLFLKTQKLGHRDLHCSNSPLHRPKHTPKPRLNRVALRVLHGGERSDLQALRLPWHEQPVADSLLPLLLLPHLPHLHSPLAICSTRQAQDLHARLMHRPSFRSCTLVPFDGTTGPKARVLGSPLHAMDPLHLHFPQHFLAWLS